MKALIFSHPYHDPLVWTHETPPAANGEMHTALSGFLSKTEAAVRRIGPLRRTEALLAFAPLN